MLGVVIQEREVVRFKLFILSNTKGPKAEKLLRPGVGAGGETVTSLYLLT